VLVEVDVTVFGCRHVEFLCSSGFMRLYHRSPLLDRVGGASPPPRPGPRYSPARFSIAALMWDNQRYAVSVCEGILPAVSSQRQILICEDSAAIHLWVLVSPYC
jgi:hypothetical protein